MMLDRAVPWRSEALQVWPYLFIFGRIWDKMAVL